MIIKLKKAKNILQNHVEKYILDKVIDHKLPLKLTIADSFMHVDGAFRDKYRLRSEVTDYARRYIKLLDSQTNVAFGGEIGCGEYIKDEHGWRITTPYSSYISIPVTHTNALQFKFLGESRSCASYEEVRETTTIFDPKSKECAHLKLMASEYKNLNIYAIAIRYDRWGTNSFMLEIVSDRPLPTSKRYVAPRFSDTSITAKETVASATIQRDDTYADFRDINPWQITIIDKYVASVKGTPFQVSLSDHDKLYKVVEYLKTQYGPWNPTLHDVKMLHHGLKHFAANRSILEIMDSWDVDMSEKIVAAPEFATEAGPYFEFIAKVKKWRIHITDKIASVTGQPPLDRPYESEFA